MAEAKGRAGEKERLKDTLARTLRCVRRRVPKPQYDSWLRPLVLRRFEDGVAEFVVANSFVREYVLERYGPVLRDAVCETLGPHVETALSCEPDLWSNLRSGHDPHAAGGVLASPPCLSGNHEPHEPREPRKPSGDLVLNPAYTFENFVTSSGNRLPCAASLAVAENRGGQYNPLFLHGGVGLGKTHLLQAICQRVLCNHPTGAVRYLSCEAFTNEFISALGAGRVGNFRQRYRNLDYLLLDDVHFLSNKERTQDEFFHTFNTLYNAQKQVVLTSDCPPSKIPAIKERLVSRFRWGMVVEVPAPDFETRAAIVLKKARLWGMEVSLDVARLIAETVTTNVRELEGATVKVIGNASLNHRPADPELARSVLRLLPRSAPRATNLDAILDAVSRHYQIKPSEIRGKRRVRSITLPRHVAMYLARELTHASLEEIGCFFGNRDHSTVLYANTRIHHLLKTNASLHERLSTIRDSLR